MRGRFKKLVASGNWSNPSIWDGGTLPSANDYIVLNNFNLNIDQNATCKAIYNHAHSVLDFSIVPQYYTATQARGDQSLVGTIIEGGTISLSSPVWFAFDQSSAAGFGNTTQWTNVSVSNPAIVGYQFPTPKIVDKIYISSTASNSNPKDVQFQASNDGVNWVILHTTPVFTTASIFYWSPSFNTTTAYTHYRLYVTSGVGSSTVQLVALNMIESNTSTTAAPYNNGGLLTFDSGDIGDLTLTCTDPFMGIVGGNQSGPFATYAGTKTFNIYAHIGRNHAFAGSQTQPCIQHNGSGVLNVVGDLRAQHKENYGSWTQTEDVYGFGFRNSNGRHLQALTAGTTNLVGTIEVENTWSQTRSLYFNNHTLNIVGNMTHIYWGTQASQFFFEFYNGTLNITGDIEVYPGSNANANSQPYNFIITGNSNIIITGAMIMLNNPILNNLVNAGSYFQWTGGTGKVLNWIGKIETRSDTWCLIVNTAEGIMLSGPLVCSPYGHFPITGLRRVNWIQNTTNTYMQFRNNQTMFLLSNPAQTPNPTYTLVSPDTLADLPLGSNVRSGVTYGAGAFTGTLAVPPANRVSAGVPVDNTVGTGTVTAQDVWNYARTNLTTPGSIGERLKNVSTVDSTGDQLTALL